MAIHQQHNFGLCSSSDQDEEMHSILSEILFLNNKITITAIYCANAQSPKFIQELF